MLEFKSSFFKSMPFGFLYIFLLLDSVYVFGISVSAQGDVNIGLATLALILFGTATLLFSYVFVFIPALPLKSGPIARNAFIFTLIEWKTNIVILASAIVPILVLVIIASYSFIIASVLLMTLLVFIHFSISQLIICLAVNRPMQKRIIEPYEQNQ